MDTGEVLVSHLIAILRLSLILSRLYMLDGIYQSAICFFMGYLLFAPATPVSETGKGVEDRQRMGVYVACATITVVNTYVLLNTYRWDWLVVLVVTICTLLIWFWTGVYSSFTASFQFYKSGAEVYGTLNFWALLLMIFTICLFPRFSIKYFQKNYRPLDVDIIREQVRQGKFKYLDQFEAYVPPTATVSAMESASTAKSPGAQPPMAKRTASLPDSQRPFYPPSETPTSITWNPRSQNGSDDTDKTRPSIELSSAPNRQSSHDRPLPSFDRPRPPMEPLRPSFEGSRDFTSAALLTRIESSHSDVRSPITPSSRRRQDITSELR